MKPRHIIASLVAATALSGTAPAQDRVAEGFRNPPKEARPNVWWHWMNGNITEDGIAKDLAWMKRIGIGGVQTFDANLLTPPVVPKRLVYMTPDWQKAFRFAATRARELGLDLTIAASPGWSETGGPWVRPEDGVKKLVWSEAVVAGGKRLSTRLAAPPSVSGPFQELPAEGDQLAAMSGEKEFKPPNHYEDVAVFAYRLPGDRPLDQPKAVSAAGKPIDMTALGDDSLTTGVDIARGSAATPTAITFDYARPQIVRSLSFHAVGGAEKFGAPFFLPELEASDDGVTWRKVADLTLTPVPTTIGFAPVKASHFRVVMRHNTAGGITGFVPAAGADLSLILPLFTPKPTIRIARLVLSGEDRVNQFEAKAGYSTVLAYAPLDAERSPASPIAADQVVNLTTRMKPDGTLDWTPPRGRWRVVRLGWSLTGKSNHPAPLEATGLEVDKLDGRAVRDYLQHYLASYKATLGTDRVAEAGLGALLTDSAEVGAFNWTPAMIAQFKRLRGYDPTPWLPTLTGAIIGSRTESDGFLYDFRRTIGDLHASEHYGTVAAVAHENGLKVYGEALEDRRPSLGDDLAMRRHADFPMAALWTYPRGTSPRPTLLGDIKGAASVAHVYGQNVVAAESMTSALQPWAHAPADLRRVIDLEFLYGVNKPSIHTSVHQPVDTVPGIPLLIFGQYFTRLDTWGEMAKPWIDYIARSSFMLQQGRNHADVAYFYGEDSPLTALYAEKPLADTPRAYAYDFVNADMLLNVLQPQGGALTAPSGASYRVLYLGGTSSRMTLPVLRRIADLAAAGATIVGMAPTESPSRADDPTAFAALLRALWSGKPTTAVGRGRVVAGTDVEAALRDVGVGADFSYAKPSPDSDVQFVHRSLSDGEVYFVNNRQNRAERIEGRFRVTGKVPELWRADTGESRPIDYRIENGSTVVSLDLAAEDSFFVVFRKPSAQTAVVAEQPALGAPMPLGGPWKVTFQPGRGAPASIELTTLKPLNEQTDTGVKYFSGVATYTTMFSLPRAHMRNGQMMLDLGQVGDLAEVKVNGVSVGTAWHAPWRLDIGKAARPGRNTLEVKVADLWVNRLIGDAQQGATKITTSTAPTYTARAPLRPSGLIGPVTLQTQRRAPSRF
jgi:hypothetical protein